MVKFKIKFFNFYFHFFKLLDLLNIRLLNVFKNSQFFKDSFNNSENNKKDNINIKKGKCYKSINF